MAAPVQIILNQDSLDEVRDKGGGGPRRDFFAHRDEDFRRHKAEIAGQLSSIAEALGRRPTGDIGILKLVLRRSAWAKSHRPTRALFKSELTPIVGGGDLGEILVEAHPQALWQIRTAVEHAETKTRVKPAQQTGKHVPYPSAARSEAGAIERIELYGPSDRRRFSVKEAVQQLANPMTGGAYHVEIFGVPLPRDQWDVVDPDRRLLHQTFVDGLQALGQGLVAKRLTALHRGHTQLSLRLERSNRPPALFLRQSITDRRSGRDFAPFDAGIDRHTRLLKFLDDHPLVRRIEIPPIIARTTIGEDLFKRSTEVAGPARTTAVALPTRNATRAYPKMGIIDGGIFDSLDAWIVDRWDTLDDVHKSLDHGTFIAGLTIGGNALNGAEIFPEPDGTILIDIATLPDEDTIFWSYYPNGTADFLDEIANAVADASTRHAVRIYNLSLNTLNQVESNEDVQKINAWSWEVIQLAHVNWLSDSCGRRHARGRRALHCNSHNF